MFYKNTNTKIYNCINIFSFAHIHASFIFLIFKIFLLKINFFLIQYISTQSSLPPLLHPLPCISISPPDSLTSAISSSEKTRVVKQVQTRYNKARRKSTYWGWTRQHNRKKKRVRNKPAPTIWSPTNHQAKSNKTYTEVLV